MCRTEDEEICADVTDDETDDETDDKIDDETNGETDDETNDETDDKNGSFQKVSSQVCIELIFFSQKKEGQKL